VKETRLADAGLADQRHDLTAPAPRALEAPPKRLRLGGATDEAREAPGRRGLEAGAHRPGPEQLVHLDRVGEPAHGDRTERADLHEPFGQSERRRRDQDRARHRRLLHAGGEVRGLAHRGVVHAQVAANRPDDHLARIHADADLDGHAGRALRALGVTLRQLLEAQRRVAGTDRVVLVGQGRAEQRHDPITHDLVHRALVAMDSVHQEIEDRVEQGPRLLGIAIGEELHRALEVGEQDGDLLALALQRLAGGEDPLGQVGRRVGPRRDDPALRLRFGAGWVRAGVTEPRSSRQGRAAARAASRQGGRALLAKSGGDRILMLAPGALHRGLRRPGRRGVRTVGWTGSRSITISSFYYQRSPSSRRPAPLGRSQATSE